MGVKSELQRGIKSGFRNYHNNAYFKAVIDLNYRNKIFDNAFRKTTNNMNTILYGPPGTGKTYHTIDLAVRIAAPDEYTEGDHEANKEVYEHSEDDLRQMFAYNKLFGTLQSYLIYPGEYRAVKGEFYEMEKNGTCALRFIPFLTEGRLNHFSIDTFLDELLKN